MQKRFTVLLGYDSPSAVVIVAVDRNAVPDLFPRDKGVALFRDVDAHVGSGNINQT